MDVKNTLPLIEKALSWLSVQRIIALGITAIIIIGSLTIFENRTQLAQSIKNTDSSEEYVQDEPFKISVSNDGNIKDFVSKNNEVALVTVISVNMRVLQRYPVYFYSSDVSIRRLVEEHVQTNMAHPFLSENEKNNVQMIALMNGEFQCFKFDETINATIFPAIKEKVKVICDIGIPPYHGQFSGYISVMLSEVPSGYKQQELKLEMVQLAASIYASDVIAKQKTR
jgi:hypothetical protein